MLALAGTKMGRKKVKAVLEKEGFTMVGLEVGPLLESGDHILTFCSNEAAQKFEREFSKKNFEPPVELKSGKTTKTTEKKNTPVTSDNSLRKAVEDMKKDIASISKSLQNMVKPNNDKNNSPDKKSQRKAKECFAYRDTGKYRYGEKCWFEHKDEKKGGKGEKQKQDKQGIGQKKPVCYNFRDTGKCKFGENCRFSHGKTPAPAVDANLQNISKQLTKLSKAVGQRITNPRARQASFQHKVEATQCKHFMQGKCTFGDKCRFQHKECWDFRSGNCTRAACSYAHCN